MAKKVKSNKKDPERKVFVIDTSVILYDSNAIKNFQEHDVAIPIQVLEELDEFKKGNETVNFEARAFIRFVDSISKEKLISDWIPLNGPDSGQFKVVLHSQTTGTDAEGVFGDSKYDNKILNCAIQLQEKNKDRIVILVSKDICLRLKAKALNIQAEDYETGKVKDVQTLHQGQVVLTEVNEKLIDDLYSRGEVGDAPLLNTQTHTANQYFTLRNGQKSVLARYDKVNAVLQRIPDIEAFGIKALNAEQNFALHALTDPSIKLVTLQG